MTSRASPEPRIAYVVASYFGIRPRADAVGDQLAARVASLMRHIERLQQLDVPEITDVLFVVNSDDPDWDGPLLGSAISAAASESPVPVSLLCRPNRGYSYGAWQAGVQQLLASDSSHFFLIEDDYLPATDRFYDAFLGAMDPRTAFVCQSFAHFPGTNPPNADVSNGLLNGAAARLAQERFGQLFGICDLPLDAGDYDVGCQNQVTYLSLLTDLGFSVGDITEGYSVPFHWFGGAIIERGVAGGVTPLEHTLG